ncbi:outer membrane protein [Sandarakinorhabdus oryzae]|uniref:outer membrane protein n=1 Tax=Sandarakinorhabdus oryzae TaxID=2675220 RepID=UPI0012E193AE|nr:outer membrane beta-barrel protein [Sandarakinorhabdus oryzae]
MIKTLISAALLSVAAGSVPAVAAPFNGPYLGVSAGWNRDDVARRTINGITIDAGRTQDAVTLGGYAGYNKTLGKRFVIGGELGFSGAIDDTIVGSAQGKALEIDPRYSFDVSARAGVLADAKTLIYARGGYANTRVRTSVATTAGTAITSDNLDGWQVGGGIERSLTENVSARIEYRYSDFGSNGGRFDRHQALIGVSYNF